MGLVEAVQHTKTLEERPLRRICRVAEASGKEGFLGHVSADQFGDASVNLPKLVFVEKCTKSHLQLSKMTQRRLDPTLGRRAEERRVLATIVDEGIEKQSNPPPDRRPSLFRLPEWFARGLSLEHCQKVPSFIAGRWVGWEHG